MAALTAVFHKRRFSAAAHLARVAVMFHLQQQRQQQLSSESSGNQQHPSHHA
jgi:hypothetical protein